MHDSISLRRSTLFSLIDSISNPNPDDSGDPNNPFGPYGPGGPVVRKLLASIDRVLLNPQPLPPRVERELEALRGEIESALGPSYARSGPVPDPWRATANVAARLGPQPDPWRFGGIVRQSIAGMVEQLRQAELVAGPDRFEDSVAAFRGQLRDLVDDWCGTRPGRWPWPWPPRPHRRELFGEELIVAGAEFGRVADAMRDNPVQRDFAAAAEQLLEAGVKRLENADAGRVAAI